MREIPLKRRTKRPLHDDWPDRIYSAEEIAEWRAKGPDYNVGLALQPGDLVLDIDPRNDPANEADPTARSADDMLRDLDALFETNLAETAPINVTGGGGLHVLMSMDADAVVRKRPFRGNPGFEFKHRRSMIVAPGSVHPDTGALYETRRAGEPLPVPPALLAAIERPVSGTAGDSELIPFSQIVRCLGELDATDFQDQEKWLELGMAVHSASGGSEEAKDLFRDWSWSDGQYQGDETVIERWDSFSDGDITSRTLFHYVAAVCGGGVPAADPVDEFDEVEDDDPVLVCGDEPIPWRWTSGQAPRVKSGLIHNILLALEYLPHTFAYNELSQRLYIDGAELQDHHVGAIMRAISDTWGLIWSGDPPEAKLFSGMVEKAMENRYHPVRDYLRSLKWDGKPRLDTWLSDFTDAEPTALTNAIGHLLLVAAVGRVMRPGVKYDVMVVLEGYQGSGKSTLVKTLGGEWTAEGMPSLGSTKDQAVVEALQGRWFVEFDELVATKKSDVDHVKAFLSRTEDRARMAYGRTIQSFPRQMVAVGTTNDQEYLRDMTGNRRFLPVRVNTVQFQEVAEVRDQLFAEAVHVWDADHPALNLPPELFEAAAQAAESRRMTDPLEDELRARLDSEDLEKIMTRQLFDMLEKAPMRATEYDAKRVANVMRRIGWDGPKNIRINGQRGKGFVRKS